MCLNRNVFAKLLQTAMTKSMCVARLNNYMSFFANAVKINRSAIFPTCLFFFFCKSWLNMCRQTGLCCVFWWHFVLPIMLLSRFFSYIISQQTFVGRCDIVALAKHGSFEFFKFLHISNLTAGECKSNLITTEYCDSFIVRSLIITASQANSYGQFWVDSLTKLHSKSRWFKDWLHFFIVKPLVTSSLRLLPDSLQA